MRAKRGQSTVELAIVVAVVVAALLGMSVYLKRAVSGHLRDAADSIGEQYAPKQTTSNITVTTASSTTTASSLERDVDSQGPLSVLHTVTMMNSPETTTRTGNETVEPLTSNLWE